VILSHVFKNASQFKCSKIVKRKDDETEALGFAYAVVESNSLCTKAVSNEVSQKNVESSEVTLALPFSSGPHSYETNLNYE
jgi:hypothetical protein